MSKPSEKAMQFAGGYTLKRVWHTRVVAGEVIQDDFEVYLLESPTPSETMAVMSLDGGDALYRACQAELEAQHRKTWALAMETFCATAHGVWADSKTWWDIERLDNEARQIPCPPIEATKDK